MNDNFNKITSTALRPSPDFHQSVKKPNEFLGDHFTKKERVRKTMKLKFEDISEKYIQHSSQEISIFLNMILYLHFIPKWKINW